MAAPLAGPVDARTASVYVERLRRLARSPGAVLDGYDLGALRWAAVVCDAELGRIEGEERARRAEDDTARIGPDGRRQ